MPAPTASPVRPTSTSTSTRGGTSSSEIVVKVNVPEVLRAELARPSWKREHVALGTNTDPYQWVEGRYRLMRGIWEALRDAANPCSILTKSPLLLRDLDLMQELAGRTEISACLSVPTLDEKAWRATEPHTPHPRERLEAVAELNRAGIPTGVLIAPLMPGINDAPEQVERIIELATEAGATSVGGQTLFLRGAVRDVFFDWLRSHRPDLVPRYERLYAARRVRAAAGERRADRAGAAGDWPRARRRAVRAPAASRRRDRRGERGRRGERRPSGALRPDGRRATAVQQSCSDRIHVRPRAARVLNQVMPRLRHRTVDACAHTRRPGPRADRQRRCRPSASPQRAGHRTSPLLGGVLLANEYREQTVRRWTCPCASARGRARRSSAGGWRATSGAARARCCSGGWTRAPPGPSGS